MSQISTRRSRLEAVVQARCTARSSYGRSRSFRPNRRAETTGDTRSDIDLLFRREAGRAVATLIRATGSFDLAEEAVQDAFVQALHTWPDRGIPRNPAAWITLTARNKAIDRLRRERVGAIKAEQAEELRALEGLGGERSEERRV